MEPLIIIVKQIKDDKIILTESELKNIIQQAYNNGYTEGNKNKWQNYPITYTNTTTNPAIRLDDYNKTPINPNIQITCEANNSIGD